jgi:hypothetical protein
MKEGDLINELVVGMAKSRRQGFSLTLGSSRFERHKRLQEFVGFHRFTGFSPVEADWFETHIGFGGARLGTRRREAQDGHAAADDDRNRDDTNERETQVPALVSKDRALPSGAGPNL